MQAMIHANTRSPGSMKRLFHHFYSLRFRLVLWYLLILAITLCVFSTIIYALQQATLYNGADTTLQLAIRTLPDLYNAQSGQLKNMNPDVYGDNTISVLLNPRGQTIQRAGRPGPLDFQRLPAHFFLSSNAADNLTEVGGSTTGNRTPHFFSTRTPVIDQAAPEPWNRYAFETVTIRDQEGQILSYVLVGVHTDISNQLSRLSSTLVLIIPLVLLVSSMGGYWLASRAIRPMQTITRTAREMSETDLRRRLNLRRRDELGELAATFDRMLDRLERAFERQRQFTADASHELRTPLSIINTEVERMLQRPHTPEEYIQSLEVVQQENQRMSRLVSDLLTLARADQGQAVLKCERVDLSEIIVDGAERLAPLAKQSGIEISLFGLDEIFVWGDRFYLIQLCTNLLENAIKYSASTGKHVDVKLKRQGNQAQIQVIDEGPGIDADHLSSLFERFYRVDQSRTHHQPVGRVGNTMGSGLGLSIARWIAREHGGSIQVQSFPGKGSIFEICLPLLPDNA